MWNKGNDYFDDIPLVPTGWVNVKVDMEIVKRVRRYASGIGENAKYSNHKTFNEKLKEFQRMSSIRRKDTSSLNRSKIQAEMSVIILLHYINEIKDFFHPSSSGFLFESFLAGLIPEARVKDDNTSADLISLNERYQIKFLDSNATYVEVVKDIKKVNNRIESSEYLEYYVIGLKYSDKIEIYIIDGRKLTDNSPLLTKGITKKIKTTKKERATIKYIMIIL